MSKIAQKQDIDVAQIATAWAVNKGTVPIIGATKVKHIEDAAKAAKVVLSAEELTQLDELGDKTAVSTIREWEKPMK